MKNKYIYISYVQEVLYVLHFKLHIKWIRLLWHTAFAGISLRCAVVCVLLPSPSGKASRRDLRERLHIQCQFHLYFVPYSISQTNVTDSIRAIFVTWSVQVIWLPRAVTNRIFSLKKVLFSQHVPSYFLILVPCDWMRNSDSYYKKMLFRMLIL